MYKSPPQGCPPRGAPNEEAKTRSSWNTRLRTTRAIAFALGLWAVPLGAREFTASARVGTLQNAVSAACQVSRQRAAQLVDLGAVRVSPHGGAFARVFDKDMSVGDDTVVRVVLHPRRYPASASVGVLYRDAHFVVIDKPAGVLSQPSDDNYLESAPGAACRLLGLQPRALTPCNRLDACTTGCLALGRGPAAQRRFSALAAVGGIRKEYIAVVEDTTDGRVSVAERLRLGGELANSMVPLKVASMVVCPGWQQATAKKVVRLRALSVEPEEVDVPQQGVEEGKDATAEEVERRWDAPRYVIRVELLTGRRHQLRAQLAALGLPIVGDSLYYPLRGLVVKDERTMAQWTQALEGWRAPPEILLFASALQVDGHCTVTSRLTAAARQNRVG